jgi:hypothetical protein
MARSLNGRGFSYKLCHDLYYIDSVSFRSISKALQCSQKAPLPLSVCLKPHTYTSSQCLGAVNAMKVQTRIPGAVYADLNDTFELLSNLLLVETLNRYPRNGFIPCLEVVFLPIHHMACKKSWVRIPLAPFSTYILPLIKQKIFV